MEPRPHYFTVKRRDAPFDRGDIVTYQGPNPVFHGQDKRQCGIVQWCRPICPQAPATCNWRVGVVWPALQEEARRWAGRSSKGNYLASNLRLVRRAPQPGTGWPPGWDTDATRPEDV